MLLAAQFLPPESLGSETDVFPFPAITGGGPRTVLGGGSMMAAFADRPEVREVVRFLLSPRHGADFAGFGGIMSSNRRLDLKNYPPFWRGQARLLDAALASDTFRFDASDLMPPSIGRGLFWNAMMTYLTKGPGSLDRILHDLDTAWPDQG